jgi:hypothetical protein
MQITLNIGNNVCTPFGSNLKHTALNTEPIQIANVTLIKSVKLEYRIMPE